PVTTYHDSIRDEQTKLFKSIRPLGPDDIVRGQFRGYRTEPGVASGSAVETFAAVRLHIDSWRWEGVPFLVRAGKCLPTTTTEIRIALRRPPLNARGARETNYVRLRLSPEVMIGIGARVKRPGEAWISEPTELKVGHQPEGDEMAGCEGLLGDAMEGDATLFAREDGVEAAWAVVQPILDATTPVHEYDPGSWGPREANAIAAEVGGWHAPEAWWALGGDALTSLSPVAFLLAGAHPLHENDRVAE